MGSPDAPTGEALRPWLRQFLSDRRVVDMNPLLWWIVLNGIILTLRPRRSADKYARIWMKEGSPLRVHTARQAKLVEDALKADNRNVEVNYGMRYGNPSIAAALGDLTGKGCCRIVYFPLYPQYSAATTGSSYDALFEHLRSLRWVPSVKVVEPFFRSSEYISALAAVIKEAYGKLDHTPERLLLSFHGMPQRCIDSGDPYALMCDHTASALREALGTVGSSVIQCYQSRFGREEWLKPYTHRTIESLAEDGIRTVAVACPGFTADCLETLDEIGNEARHDFIKAGGESLTLIPCLNDHPAWISGMVSLIKRTAGDWI